MRWTPGPHTRLLLLRLGLVLLLLMVLRVVFYLANNALFPSLGAGEAGMVLLQGYRFDAMTIVVFNALFILLHLLPLPWREKPSFQRSLLVLFLVVNIPLLLFCCIDLAYFGFSGKRIGRDLLGQASAGVRMLPSFMIHYWWVAFTFVVCVFLLWKGYARRIPAVRPVSGKKQWLLLPLPLLAFVLIGRGGWQYQGLSPAHAADHVQPANAPLVTNSAFTFLYALQAPEVEAYAFFPDNDLDQRLPLDMALQRESGDRPMNVVLLIVESLGREYVSPISGCTSYMPFIDSLCMQSFVYTNAYANAERSNKSMCAILAGIPSLTDDAFMNTAYADDQVDGLGSRLKEMGYTTAFFHGGLNGEYKFDSFTKACGFDRYYGKDEFGNDDAFDGHWGIYDEEFLQFAAEQMNALPQPFCAVEFTLSSHDPFPVPPRYKGHFPKGDQEIHESLGYADMALRRFFDRVKHEPWFANTLFVVTGDHTFLYNDHPLWYRNPAGRFSVPIMFFAGDGSMHGSDSLIAQHLDIVPTILDHIGYQGTIRSFGQSLQHRRWPGYAVQRSGAEYRLITDDRLLTFSNKEPQGLFAYKTDTVFKTDLLQQEAAAASAMAERLEAILQQHSLALRTNALRAKK